VKFLHGLLQVQQDAYPLSRINESLDAIASSKYFNMLNLMSKFLQVPLNPDAQDIAAPSHAMGSVNGKYSYYG